jgi:flavin-dependent dehydrogenase
MAGNRERCTVSCKEPLLIASRKLLGEYLLDAAVSRGVRLIQDRVESFTSHQSGWRIRAGNKSYGCGVLVGADGAKSSIRRHFFGPLPREDKTLAVGYLIEADFPEEVVIAFLPDLYGYIWIFPRQGHLSVGIGAKADEVSGKALLARLDDFLNANYPGLLNTVRKSYAALIPSLTTRRAKSNKVCGENWALVGDAGGWADPLTGEGIYYAFRSAELFSEAFQNGGIPHYGHACHQELVPELSRAASYVRTFFRPEITTRLVSLSRREPAIQSLLVSLITGEQGYITLKKEVLKVLPRISRDILFRIFRNG